MLTNVLTVRYGQKSAQLFPFARSPVASASARDAGEVRTETRLVSEARVALISGRHPGPPAPGAAAGEPS